MSHLAPRSTALVLLTGILIAVSRTFASDPVIDWNAGACSVVVAAHFNAPHGHRVIALMQTAVFAATNAISQRYPEEVPALSPDPEASMAAAIGAASRVVLSDMVPSQRDFVDSLYAVFLSAIPAGELKSRGIRIGEAAAKAVLAARSNDGANAMETYRPRTSAGTYVPTTTPAVPQWPVRTPWLMSSPSQFRPGPPPALSSPVWARDYNEIKGLGAKNSMSRTPEQTLIARFWETTEPSIYYGVVHCVARLPGRDITQNARLMMAVAQAIDDGMIAVFDAKYYYGFWRPVTAIRNGDIDGNEATDRDSSWTPFITTPMHPEYPCAHCVTSGVVGTVLKAAIGNGPTPPLTTSSPTADGVSRTWTSLEDFMQEVDEARICDGVHFRTSTIAGTALGKRVGALSVARYFQRK